MLETWHERDSRQDDESSHGYYISESLDDTEMVTIIGWALHDAVALNPDTAPRTSLSMQRHDAPNNVRPMLLKLTLSLVILLMNPFRISLVTAT